jgi:UDP-3-O-[3-hydroxymyristoyl] glucosamine N-acyltransferase
MKLKQIADTLGVRLDCAPGTSPAFEQVEISGVVGIETAGPTHITFIANQKYASAAKTTLASAVFVSDDFTTLPTAKTAALRTKNPYLAFAKAIELFYQPPKYGPGIHSTAVIDRSAKIGRGSHVGAYVVIGPDVLIGDKAIILPHVVIYGGARIGKNFFAHAHSIVREHCRLGDNVVLQNGAIVGADGFGFAKDETGHWQKIVQSGPAILENDVEIQANACIDRASIGETHISRGAKVDNLVQVGHGSSVGEDTLLCAQVGLAGSSEVGKNVVLAGQVGVAGHCRIGDGVVATAQSGIPNDVEPGKMISGYPAIDNRQWLKCVSIYNRLPEIAKALRGFTPSSAGKDK